MEGVFGRAEEQAERLGGQHASNGERRVERAEHEHRLCRPQLGAVGDDQRKDDQAPDSVQRVVANIAAVQVECLENEQPGAFGEQAGTQEETVAADDATGECQGVMARGCCSDTALRDDSRAAANATVARPNAPNHTQVMGPGLKRSKCTPDTISTRSVSTRLDSRKATTARGSTSVAAKSAPRA